MIKDFGAQLDILSGGGARGVAAGTGDNTEAYGDIVDSLSQPQCESGIIFVAGSAVLADTESIDIDQVKIEHGDAANLSDAADFTTPVDFAAVKTSSGGTTELFAIKVNVANMAGLKRYWRVACTPDLSASATDTFQIGFGCVGYSREAPHNS
jgi:hypothetical protein